MSASDRGRVKTRWAAASGGSDEARSAYSSGPDRFHQGLRAQHRHHPLHVVGQDVEADLGLHVGQPLHQEVSVAHPGLDRAERVFDQPSSGAHGARGQVHPRL